MCMWSWILDGGDGTGWWIDGVGGAGLDGMFGGGKWVMVWRINFFCFILSMVCSRDGKSVPAWKSGLGIGTGDAGEM